LPSKRPEKLSVALHLFFFLCLFLASGISMGLLDGISLKKKEEEERNNFGPSSSL